MVKRVSFGGIGGGNSDKNKKNRRNRKRRCSSLLIPYPEFPKPQKLPDDEEFMLRKKYTRRKRA